MVMGEVNPIDACGSAIAMIFITAIAFVCWVALVASAVGLSEWVWKRTSNKILHHLISILLVAIVVTGTYGLGWTLNQFWLEVTGYPNIFRKS